MKHIINVENITIKYGENKALENVNFTIEKPSITIIMGPNAAGKTTLLKTLIGLTKPLSGRIEVLGIDPMRKRFDLRKLIGYIPQRDRISTNVPIKVMDVILMGLTIKKNWPRVIEARDIEKMRKIAKSFEIEDILNKNFHQLSGGQQQKVLLARTLISEPKILMLDEPFNGVDIISQSFITNKLRELHENNNTTILIATHDINPIIELAENLMILNKRVISFGKIDEVLREENLSKAYGGGKIILAEGKYYSIIGDTHTR